jgi:hypothetical protein
MPAPGSRATKVEKESRIFTVQGWIVKGIQPTMIIQNIVAEGWCNKRQAERILEEARRRWCEGPKADIDQKRLLRIAELQQMARDLDPAFRNKPSGMAVLLQIQKQIIVLEGLTPQAGPPVPPKPEPEQRTELDVTALSDETLKQIANARRSKSI